jgi:hypothetical protein
LNIKGMAAGKESSRLKAESSKLKGGGMPCKTYRLLLAGYGCLILVAGC